MSDNDQPALQCYSHYEGGSGGGVSATLTLAEDHTAELKIQHRSMGSNAVDGLVVFQVKPLHELHGLLRVDSVLMAPGAGPVAGFRLAAQLWGLSVGDDGTEEGFLSEQNWDREHLFYAGATYEYLKTAGSIPRVPNDVGLIDMQPNTYWNKTFDLILFARFAPQDVRDTACRQLLEWADKMKFSAESQAPG